MGVDLAVEGRAVPVTADARDIAQVAAAKQAAEASAFERMTLAMATPGYGAPIATPAPERPNWPAAKGEGFDRIPAGAVEAATFVQPTPTYAAPELAGPVGDRPRLTAGGIAQALARRFNQPVSVSMGRLPVPDEGAVFFPDPAPRRGLVRRLVDRLRRR